MLKLLKKLMNKMTIKTDTRVVTHNVSGSNVTINNRRVYVNGKLVETIDVVEGNDIKVTWEGDLASLDCTNCVINGNVKGKVDSTNTTIHGNVGGDVDATNVKCNNIAGNVDAMNVSGGIRM